MYNPFLSTMKGFNNLAIIFMVCFGPSILYGQDLGSKGYQSFGAVFSEEKEAVKNSALYEKIRQTDTITTQLVGEIKEVCQAKGCWMKVNLKDNKEVFVKFKDYGFFIPLDTAGKKAVMNGIAFIEEVSVEEQKHYAMDNGASKEAIEKITLPKKTFRFEAAGVLIEK